MVGQAGTVPRPRQRTRIRKGKGAIRKGRERCDVREGRGLALRDVKISPANGPAIQKTALNCEAAHIRRALR